VEGVLKVVVVDFDVDDDDDDQLQWKIFCVCFGL